MTAETAELLDELQHRPRAGYRLIQTLVGIRLRSVQDPESRRHLAWLSDVTAALDLLERRLAGEEASNFGAYLRDTAAFWTRATESQSLRFDVRATDAALPEPLAQALAIITHELLTNAVRHAFPGDRRGSVAIAFSRAPDGVSLVVRDSGLGAESIKPAEGLTMVAGLVEHLGGSMGVEATPGSGVGVRVHLPLDSRPAH